MKYFFYLISTLCILAVARPASASETVADYGSSCDPTHLIAGMDSSIGHKFHVAGGDYLLTSLTVYAYDLADNDLDIILYADTNGLLGAPIAVLRSNTTLTSSSQQSFDLSASGVTVEDGNDYWLVFHVTSDDSLHSVIWQGSCATSSNLTYANGFYSDLSRRFQLFGQQGTFLPSCSTCVRVDSIDPPNGIVDFAHQSNITITLSGTVASNCFTASNILVRGQQFGIYPGNLVTSATDTLTFIPSNRFLFGEQVGISIVHPICPTSTIHSAFSIETLGCEIIPEAYNASLPSVSNQSDSVASFAIGDLNGDTYVDILRITQDGGSQIIYLNDGDGNFTTTETISVPTGACAVALGDLDNDGDLDAFVITESGGADMVFVNSGGSLSTNQMLGASDATALALADVDGDGDLDAYIATTGADLLCFNNGAAIFTPTGPFGTLLSTDVGAGDLDGDGDNDFAVAHGMATNTTIYLNDGTGVFTVTNYVDVDYALSYEGHSQIELGNLDGDGDIDLVAFGALTTYPSSDESFFTFRNLGDGTFTLRQDYRISPLRDFSLSLGDVDGDGNLDVHMTTIGTAVIYTNNGSARFYATYVNSSFIYGSTLGDLDGDGDLDHLASGRNVGEYGGFGLSLYGDRAREFVPCDDFDGDQIPNSWEIDMGSDPTRDDANEDMDGDFVFTIDEYRADTRADDGEDFFEIHGVDDANSINIYFQASTNREYSVETIDYLATGTWVTVEGMTNLTGLDPEALLTITNLPNGSRHFRVKAEIPNAE